MFFCVSLALQVYKTKKKDFTTIFWTFNFYTKFEVRLETDFEWNVGYEKALSLFLHFFIPILALSSVKILRLYQHLKREIFFTPKIRKQLTECSVFAVFWAWLICSERLI